MDRPIGGAAPEDLARAVGTVVGDLPPENLQYSIDIVGAVAQTVEPAAAQAAAEAARSAVAEIAAANPELVDDWWAELIEDSISMVVGADAPSQEMPETPAGPDEALPSLSVEQTEAPEDAADTSEIELSTERQASREGAAEGETSPPIEYDLALSTEMLTRGSEAAEAPPDDDPATAEGPVAGEQVIAEGPASEDAGPDEEPASEITGEESTEGTEARPPDQRPPEGAAIVADAAPEDEAAGPSSAVEPQEPEGIGEADVAALPLAPAGPSETDLLVSRLLGDLRKEGEEAAAPTSPALGSAPTPDPDIPVEIDRMLRSFDGIIELVEFWLQEPIEQASTLELAQAVQATILMLPPDNLSAASSVAGSVVAVVTGPEAVRAVTRAAEAGVQVKVARHPGALTSAEIDHVLAAIGTATGNLGAIQPAAGGFVPGPVGIIDDQGIDGGS